MFLCSKIIGALGSAKQSYSLKSLLDEENDENYVEDIFKSMIKDVLSFFENLKEQIATTCEQGGSIESVRYICSKFLYLCSSLIFRGLVECMQELRNNCPVIAGATATVMFNVTNQLSLRIQKSQKDISDALVQLSSVGIHGGSLDFQKLGKALMQLKGTGWIDVVDPNGLFHKTMVEEVKAELSYRIMEIKHSGEKLPLGVGSVDNVNTIGLYVQRLISMETLDRHVEGLKEQREEALV